MELTPNDSRKNSKEESSSKNSKDEFADIEKCINRFISEVREFGKLSDNEMREVLWNIVRKNPELFEAIQTETQRKTLKEIKKMIKEVGNKKELK